MDLHRERVRAEIYARRGDRIGVPPILALQANLFRQVHAQQADPQARVATELATPSKGRAYKDDPVEDLRVYTLQRAIADALRYYEACSVPAGLEEASDGIRESRSPSLDKWLDQTKLVTAAQTEVEQNRANLRAIRKGRTGASGAKPAPAKASDGT